MRVPMKYAVFGALAYGLSTYLLIIIQVGHNTKAQALGYLPFVLAGVQWIFRKKYFWGFAFSTFAIALQIRANHYQITYYMLLFLYKHEASFRPSLDNSWNLIYQYAKQKKQSNVFIDYVDKMKSESFIKTFN